MTIHWRSALFQNGKRLQIAEILGAIAFVGLLAFASIDIAAWIGTHFQSRWSVSVSKLLPAFGEAAAKAALCYAIYIPIAIARGFTSARIGSSRCVQTICNPTASRGPGSGNSPSA